MCVYMYVYISYVTYIHTAYMPKTSKIRSVIVNCHATSNIQGLSVMLQIHPKPATTPP